MFHIFIEVDMTSRLFSKWNACFSVSFWKGLILSMLPRYDVVLHHVIEWYAGKTKHNFSKI